ncbi:hypothetical protein CLV67_11366 [Actinoplanes italicus]|uniref:Uncharacterized protein n=1 Tax=Actinoplanes italicus TaxID=113567 RepID=A0A2T0K5I2_9ACTN|nr:hypothetical protein CLV67_11366 [Actinoplanes italicus]
MRRFLRAYEHSLVRPASTAARRPVLPSPGTARPAGQPTRPAPGTARPAGQPNPPASRAPHARPDNRTLLPPGHRTPGRATGSRCRGRSPQVRVFRQFAGHRSRTVVPGPTAALSDPPASPPTRCPRLHAIPCRPTTATDGSAHLRHPPARKRGTHARASRVLPTPPATTVRSHSEAVDAHRRRRAGKVAHSSYVRPRLRSTGPTTPRQRSPRHRIRRRSSTQPGSHCHPLAAGIHC